MRCIAAAVIVVLAVSLAGCWLLGSTPTPQTPRYSLVEIRDILARNQHLRDQVRTLSLIHEFVDEVVEDYRANRLTHYEACDRIIAHAQEFRPEYLKAIDAMDPNGTLREKVARRLAQRFAPHDTNPVAADQVPLRSGI
jgi:hypothetical protein